MSYEIEGNRRGIFKRRLLCGDEKVLIKGIETAAARAKTKEAYTNPSSTVHLLTDEILKSKR